MVERYDIVTTGRFGVWTVYGAATVGPMTNHTTTNPTDDPNVTADVIAPDVIGSTIVTMVPSDDGTTYTVTHVSGIVRTLSADHPAVMWVIANRPDDWCVGTGRGFARTDIIMHGHVTGAGNVRRYTCETCGVRHPATKFPTYHRPRADGRTRNTAECRACRDDRYAAARADADTAGDDA